MVQIREEEKTEMENTQNKALKYKVRSKRRREKQLLYLKERKFKMKKTQLLKKQLQYFCRTNLSTFEQILAFEPKKPLLLNKENLPKKKKKFCT